MTPEYLKSQSKFISLILRHKPEVIGLSLDKNGWAMVDDLLTGAMDKGRELDLPMLEAIVATDEKQRYSFNEDKTKIRANQGHSIKVDLELEAEEPPKLLYHGTEERLISHIMQHGLVPRNRNHIHLSEDAQSALEVSEEKGDPIVFKIYARAMFKRGFKFYKSANGIWLTTEVPNMFLDMV